MKKILIIFILVFSVSFSDLFAYISTPNKLTLVKAIDPDKGPTEVTFSFIKKEEVDGYQVFYGSTKGEYTKSSKVFSSYKYDNILNFNIDANKGDVLYFVLQAYNRGTDYGVSEFSEPLRVVIGGENINELNSAPQQPKEIPKTQEIEEKNELPEITRLPTTGPEHVLLLILSLFISWFIFFRNPRKV